MRFRKFLISVMVFAVACFLASVLYLGACAFLPSVPPYLICGVVTGTIVVLLLLAMGK
jgi:hypothetical protein